MMTHLAETAKAYTQARAPLAVPPVVRQVLQTPGRPLDLETRALMEPRFGHDFGRVRVHTDTQAARSAQSVNASAYTVGQNVIFGAGQYAPNTDAGNSLLAHELAHTIQQGPQSPAAGRQLEIGPSSSPFEREADVAAAQVTAGGPVRSIASAAASHLLQRQPAKAGAFDSEDPTLAARRTAAIGALRTAFQRLNTGISSGFLWSFETVTPGGIDLTPIASSLSPEAEAARATRLKKLLADLILVISDLESAPIPASWLISPVQFPTGTYAVTGGTQGWQDAQMFYAQRNVALGMPVVTTNVFYIETAPLPTRKLKSVAIASGIQTGVYIVLPNETTEPLVYRPLRNNERIGRNEAIVEVWHDDLGYYYVDRDGTGKKHYLPGFSIL